jgi:hypothetical protein
MYSQHYLHWINTQVILAAADALRQEDFHLLKQLGLDHLDEEVASRLKQVSADRLSCLSNFKGSLFQMKVDTTALRHFLDLANERVSEDELINRAIMAGLRQPTLEELKGTTRREYASRRSRMNLPDHTRGRIEALSDEDELSVLRSWKQLDVLEDYLERLVALHEKTGISLDQAYSTIKELA